MIKPSFSTSKTSRPIHLSSATGTNIPTLATGPISHVLQIPSLEYVGIIAPVAIIDRQLPFEYTIASRSTDVMVWNAVYDAHNEVACLMLGSMTPELHGQLENSSPYEIIQELKSMFDKQARVELFDLIQTFHACKPEEEKSVSSYVLKMKGHVEQLERLGYVLPQDLSVGLIMASIGATPQVMAIQGDRIQKSNKKSLNAKGKGKEKCKGKDKSYIPKTKNPKPSAKENPTNDDTYHYYKEVGHYKRNFPAYLAKLIKKKKQVGTASSSAIKEPSITWTTFMCHYRLAHISKKRIKKLQQDGLLKSMDEESFDQCVSCLTGKMTRKPFPHRTERATDLLGIIHTYVCGPLRHVSRQDASYFITFMDDYSRYGYIYLLKHKHEVFETFKVFKNEVENQLGKTIKALRLDQGGEYISQKFKDYLNACGIVQQLTPSYTPQHNGLSERRNRTLLGMLRSMMNLTTLSLSFWDYTLEIAIRILNMVPTKKVDKTPYELWIPNGETMGLLFLPPENKIVVTRIQDEDTITFENTLVKFLWKVEGHSLGILTEPIAIKLHYFDLESNKWLDAMGIDVEEKSKVGMCSILEKHGE
ncbi:retrotransposon protein, putative, ty1-copia subclass [Tanacetum coccineum]